MVVRWKERNRGSGIWLALGSFFVDEEALQEWHDTLHFLWAHKDAFNTSYSI